MRLGSHETNTKPTREMVGFLLPPLFSKGDAENRIVGGGNRHTADDWEQILYYQVNYLIIVLLGTSRS